MKFSVLHSFFSSIIKKIVKRIQFVTLWKCGLAVGKRSGRHQWAEALRFPTPAALASSGRKYLVAFRFLEESPSPSWESFTTALCKMCISWLFFFYPPGNFQFGIWSTPMFGDNHWKCHIHGVFFVQTPFFLDKWASLIATERVSKLKNSGVLIGSQTCIWACLYEEAGYYWCQGHQLFWSTCGGVTCTSLQYLRFPLDFAKIHY